MSTVTKPQQPPTNCTRCKLPIEPNEPYVTDPDQNPYHPPCVIDPNGPTRTRYNLHNPLHLRMPATPRTPASRFRRRIYLFVTNPRPRLAIRAVFLALASLACSALGLVFGVSARLLAFPALSEALAVGCAVSFWSGLFLVVAGRPPRWLPLFPRP